MSTEHTDSGYPKQTQQFSSIHAVPDINAFLDIDRCVAPQALKAYPLLKFLIPSSRGNIMKYDVLFGCAISPMKRELAQEVVFHRWPLMLKY